MGAHTLLWLAAGVLAIVYVFVGGPLLALGVVAGAVAELVTERD